MASSIALAGLSATLAAAFTTAVTQGVQAIAPNILWAGARRVAGLAVATFATGLAASVRGTPSQLKSVAKGLGYTTLITAFTKMEVPDTIYAQEIAGTLAIAAGICGISILRLHRHLNPISLGSALGAHLSWGRPNDFLHIFFRAGFSSEIIRRLFP